MILHSWGSSESIVLDLKTAQPRRFGNVFWKETSFLKSLNNIKRVQLWHWKKPKYICLLPLWTAAKEVTISHGKHNLKEQQAYLLESTSPYPRKAHTVPVESTTSRSMLKNQALVSTFCLILYFCLSKKWALQWFLISSRGTIRKPWLLCPMSEFHLIKHLSCFVFKEEVFWHSDLLAHIEEAFASAHCNTDWMLSTTYGDV